MAVPLGNFAALRTMRVLRALKTVAVVPGWLTFDSPTFRHLVLLSPFSEQRVFSHY